MCSYTHTKPTYNLKKLQKTLMEVNGVYCKSVMCITGHDAEVTWPMTLTNKMMQYEVRLNIFWNLIKISDKTLFWYVLLPFKVESCGFCENDGMASEHNYSSCAKHPSVVVLSHFRNTAFYSVNNCNGNAPCDISNPTVWYEPVLTISPCEKQVILWLYIERKSRCTLS